MDATFKMRKKFKGKDIWWVKWLKNGVEQGFIFIQLFLHNIHFSEIFVRGSLHETRN